MKKSVAITHDTTYITTNTVVTTRFCGKRTKTKKRQFFQIIKSRKNLVFLADPPSVLCNIVTASTRPLFALDIRTHGVAVRNALIHLVIEHRNPSTTSRNGQKT